MNEQLWDCFQEALDARRDPLAEEDVRAELLEHSDDALELCDLRAALGALERADMPLRVERSRRLVPLAAAALAFAAIGSWFVMRPRAMATPALTAAQLLELQPIVPAPTLGSVQSWTIVSSLETADETSTLRVSAGRITLEHEYHAPLGSEPGLLAQAAVLATLTETWSSR